MVGEYVHHAQRPSEKAGELVVDFDLHPTCCQAMDFDVVHDVSLCVLIG